MTDKLTVRDRYVLRRAARGKGLSLRVYVGKLLHERAQQERHRQLFAIVAGQEPDLPWTDAVAEVRAIRDEKDHADAALADLA